MATKKVKRATKATKAKATKKVKAAKKAKPAVGARGRRSLDAMTAGEMITYLLRTKAWIDDQALPLLAGLDRSDPAPGIPPMPVPPPVRDRACIPPE